MKKIFVKNTYTPKVKGQPKLDLFSIEGKKLYGVAPARLNLKVKLLVKQNDQVLVGTPLFFDKKNQENVFLSPVSGKIKEIVLGHKRVVEHIVIESDESFKALDIFEKLDLTSLANLESNEVSSLLQKGGLWSSLVSYPFNVIPSCEELPPAIYVTLDNDELFTPDSQVLMKDNDYYFQLGLEALRKISPQVHVGIAQKSKIKEPKIRQEATHQIVGNYPANNPGVFLYYNKKTAEENASWGIKGYDVVRIGSLLANGQYPNKKIISVGGSLVTKPAHYEVVEGLSLKELLQDNLTTDTNMRVICGGIFTGTKVNIESYLSYNDNAVNVIPDEGDQELLHFFKPGFHRPTFSKTYLSFLFKNKHWDLTSSLNGGKRACIACGACVKVCPVGSYPQMIMKSLKDNDYETAVEYGLLDVVESGLYSYVCPSKIEIDKIFSDAKNKLYKELTA